MKLADVKELLTVKGKPGLWKLIKVIPAQRMARIQKLITEEAATVKVADIIAIDQYKIYLKPGEINLEKVFETMMIMEENGELKPEELEGYDTLSEPEKHMLMSRIVPNYDETQFKHYHLSKLIKWYKELYKVLDINDTALKAPNNAEQT